MPALAKPTDVVGPTPAQVATEVRCSYRTLIRELRVEEAEGGVILHGSTYSYYGKQVAQHEVLRRTGLVLLANWLQVVELTGAARG